MTAAVITEFTDGRLLHPIPRILPGTGPVGKILGVRDISTEPAGISVNLGLYGAGGFS